MRQNVSDRDLTITWLYEDGTYKGYCKIPYVSMTIKTEGQFSRLQIADEAPSNTVNMSMLLESFEACTEFTVVILAQIVQARQMLSQSV